MSDLKPLTEIELDDLERLWQGAPFVVRAIAMARRSLEIPSLEVRAYSKGLKAARASLAPKGWPLPPKQVSPPDVQAACDEWFERTKMPDLTHNRAYWMRGFEAGRAHHAAPQAEADRSDEERARNLSEAWVEKCKSHGTGEAELSLLDVMIAQARREAQAPLEKLLSLYRAEAEAAEQLVQEDTPMSDFEPYRAARAARIAAEKEMG